MISTLKPIKRASTRRDQNMVGKGMVREILLTFTPTLQLLPQRCPRHHTPLPHPLPLLQNATSPTKNKVYMFGGLTTSQSCSSRIVGANALGVAQGSASIKDCTQNETFRWLLYLLQGVMSRYLQTWVQCLLLCFRYITALNKRILLARHFQQSVSSKLIDSTESSR